MNRGSIMSTDRKYILPVFIPDEGCPFKCIFCNQERITGSLPDKDIRIEIVRYLSYFKDKSKKIMLCFYGGSFTGLDLKKQQYYLDVANEYMTKGIISEIGLSTRPDFVTPQILIMLRQYNVSTIEIGAQSLVDSILIKSKRGHTYKDIENACHSIKEYGFKLGIQLLIGLLGETNRDIITTIKRTILLKPDFVRIYPLLVLKNTYLETLYQKNEYTPLTLEKAVRISLKMLERFISNGIGINRIGLQNTKEISKNADVIAGPFFESFGQLVLSEYIFKNVIKQTKGYDKINKVDVYVGRGMVSAARGHKNCITHRIMEALDTQDIVFHETCNDRYYVKAYVRR